MGVIVFVDGVYKLRKEECDEKIFMDDGGSAAVLAGSSG